MNGCPKIVWQTSGTALVADGFVAVVGVSSECEREADEKRDFIDVCFVCNFQAAIQMEENTQNVVRCAKSWLHRK